MATFHNLHFQFLETFLMFMDNSYKIPNFHVHGQLCRTNLPTYASFRGFGSPQSQFVMQTVLQHIAETLRLLPGQVRVVSVVLSAIQRACIPSSSFRYLCPFSHWEHRPPTEEHHCFLSMAILSISLLVYPISFVSLPVSYSPWVPSFSQVR